MNRLSPSLTCGVCAFHFHRAWERETSEAVRDRLKLQAYNGICDPCQRERQDAALNFIRASDALRVLHSVVGHANHGPAEGVAFTMYLRVQMAEQRCVDLKMWPAHRDATPADRYLTGEVRRRRTWGATKKSATEKSTTEKETT